MKYCILIEATDFLQLKYLVHFQIYRVMNSSLRGLVTTNTKIGWLHLSYFSFVCHIS